MKQIKKIFLFFILLFSASFSAVAQVENDSTRISIIDYSAIERLWSDSISLEKKEFLKKFINSLYIENDSLKLNDNDDSFQNACFEGGISALIENVSEINTFLGSNEMKRRKEILQKLEVVLKELKKSFCKSQCCNK